MSEDPNPRLNSWKQIARYLGRDVRTVRRWENKGVGMPVHRVPGGRSVFAYTRELDAWLVDGTPLEALQRPDQLFSLSRLQLGLGVMGLVAIAAALVGSWPSPTPKVMRLETLDGHVIALDPVGDVAWTYEHSEGRSFEHTVPLTLVTERRPEGDDLLLLATTTIAVEEEPRVGAELFAFGTEGQLRWQSMRTESYRFGRETYSESWVSSALAAHDMSTGVRIAWAIHDHNWWPSALFLLDDRGSVEGTFVNSGWITRTTFVNHPEEDLLLAGGISNSRMGAMVAVLDASDIQGHSPEESGSEFACLDCPLRYFVFPPTDVSRASGLAYNETVGIDPGTSQIRITVMEGPPSSDVVSVYLFTTAFDLIRVTPGDSFWPTHDLLELEGKLDHSAEACPWRVAPPILSWTPDGGWTELTAPPIS